MAHTSGTTSKGIGPSGGLLEALINFVTSKQGTAATNQSLGTPDGTIVTFAGSLTNSDINQSTFVMSYTIATVTYTSTVTDSGAISGTNISSGQIDADGSYTITFSIAPDNGSALTADYDYDYIPGRDWDITLDHNARDLQGDDTPWGSDAREIVLHNNGLAKQDNVLVGIREWKWPSSDAYGWNLNGYAQEPVNTDWNESLNEHGRSLYNDSSHSWDAHPTLQMFDGIIAYWIYSNKQRIIVQIRCSSDYYCCYLGLANRYDPHSEYPNPLVISGTCLGTKAYTDNACADYRDGGWSPVRPLRQYQINSSDWNSTMWVVGATGQWYCKYNNQRHIPYDGRFGREDWIENYSSVAINDVTVVDEAANGSYLTLPSYINVPDGSELSVDGMRILRKNNVSSEDTITDLVTGDVWRLFQSGSNTSASAWHAIKEE